MVKLLFTHSEILLLPTSKRDWLIVFHSSKGEIIQCGNKLFPHRIGQGGGGWAVTAELGGGRRMGDGWDSLSGMRASCLCQGMLKGRVSLNFFILS